MKGYQTPKQDRLRPSDPSNRSFKESQSKKLQKVEKKNLNAEFDSVFEDHSPEIIKEPVDFFPTSEISDANFTSNIVESFTLAPNPPLEPFSLSDLTPSTINKNESDLSPDHYHFNDGSNVGSLEADVVVNLLKAAQNQVSSSIDIDARPKRLLDALINFAVGELYKVPEERDRFPELVSTKTRIMCTCFLIWILSVSVILLFNSGSGRTFTGPLPT